ncbi:AP-3 complex subunit beta-1 like [Actinidia chinensis var. chinensis]|uniref:AP-3 complex subunit beta-1 like n=1 Tax=Actinidia chinensis var. chinensis TaxID=1590841 RepID=A0A2R6PFR9_ACTCC|nr:AP-3 complex subunit beta-1 like [Actinidia chinensis var. chinensis]
MGRGRGKGKKFSVTNHKDAGSGEEEKIPVQKRRGRPQKSLTDSIDEEEFEKVEEEDSDNLKNGVSSKETKSSITAENGKKRKRNSQAKEKSDSVKLENGVGNRSSTDDSTKSNGFRHNGSRRKSKPHRAAEAVVECN